MKVVISLACMGCEEILVCSPRGWTRKFTPLPGMHTIAVDADLRVTVDGNSVPEDEIEPRLSFDGTLAEIEEKVADAKRRRAMQQACSLLGVKNDS